MLSGTANMIEVTKKPAYAGFYLSIDKLNDLLIFAS